MADRDRPATPLTEAQRAGKFVQPDDSVEVTSGDASTTPEALGYLLEHGTEAWARRYGPAANTGGVVE